MAKRKRLVPPTLVDLRRIHNEITVTQFNDIEKIKSDLIDINLQLQAIRELAPRMRSQRMQKELSERQIKLIETRAKLHENLTILHSACISPLVAIAKIIESESKSSESEAPILPVQQQRISDEELQAMYVPYEAIRFS